MNKQMNFSAFNVANHMLFTNDIEQHDGYFGEFGGAFVPPMLEEPLKALEQAFYSAVKDETFQKELAYYQKQYIGRSNPLYFTENLSKAVGGARIYLKREDLNHTGAHKINNTVGQILLAKRMGKDRVIAETGAGQHGVATATVCALFNMKCTVYMGAVDCERQKLNVFRMKMLGAEVIPVEDGTATLKDAVDAALMDYAQNSDAFYLLGSAVGPHPYPLMVRTFQSVVGVEARAQILEAENRLPDAIIAAVGGGSNAIGLFHAFMDDKDVRIIGVEPGGKGIDTPDHAASICVGSPGVIHGFKCMTLSDSDGNPLPVHSIAAGLDYPGVGPEHSHLHTSGRAEYTNITDAEALEAFFFLTRSEGIIPALESSHAVAQGIKTARGMRPDQIVIVNLSGRGDKDVEQLMNMPEIEKFM